MASVRFSALKGCLVTILKKEKALFLKTKKQFPNLENIFNILLTKKKKKLLKNLF